MHQLRQILLLQEELAQARLRLPQVDRVRVRGVPVPNQPQRQSFVAPPPTPPQTQEKAVVT